MKDLLELESASNLVFERRSWWVERVGWLALALWIGAALAGLLGPGPLSTVHARTPDGELSVVYPRFMRVRSASQIQLRVRADDAAELQVWLAGSWAARMRPLGISPAPLRSELHGSDWVLVFATPSGSAPELDVSLDVEPRSAGWLDGAVGLATGPRLPLHQLVYP